MNAKSTRIIVIRKENRGKNSQHTTQTKPHYYHHHLQSITATVLTKKMIIMEVKGSFDVKK
ncbi:hypothetical protein DERP_008958 [Dermatophagoides pteronyssinus]|uniref:Uncharacterized protein n=1 Tax=Dermatophagoides pteronyssinus TaxID=6956 RepID=A0ABQ8JGJ9_DERPT|nr:hypothetical protein DERP_008958 [Dermatophagoides pteronyssinus]